MISFFLMNSRPKEPGPQLLAIAEEAFCRYTLSNGQYCRTRYWIQSSLFSSIPAYVINKIRLSIFLVSRSTFLIQRFATCSKFPISILPTDILLFLSTITGCRSSASQRTCIRLEIRPDRHIICVLSMMKSEEI